MNIQEIKRKLNKAYDIEYDYVNKILYIHKPISISDFKWVKELNKEYKEVRVEPRNGIRW